MLFLRQATVIDVDRDTKRRRQRESKNLARVISDDPSIFRGVRPGTLLEFGGHWLRSGPITDPKVAEVGYHMSFQVERLATFLSHSWHANALKKVLALYAHYNAPSAVVLALLASGLVAWLQHSGVVPPLQQDSDPSVIKLMADLDLQNFHMYSSVLFTYAAVYTLCLLFWCQAKRFLLELLRLLGCKRSPGALTGGAVFLDKLCIHQTDADRKQQGIRAIGSYLTQCDELLVAWDETYFTRLWCVFELCIFLAINPRGKIHLMPIDWYSAETIMSLVCCMGAVVVVAMQLSGFVTLVLQLAPTRLAWGAFFAGVIGLVFPVVVMTMRKMTHTRKVFFAEIDTFSVGAAKCFMESDRGFVVDVIRNLYGDEESFNKYVKYQLKAKISYQLGSNMRIPYLMIVRCLMPFWMLFAVEFAMGLTDLSIGQRWHWFLGQTVCFFTHVPLLITALEMLCHLSLRYVDWWAGGLAMELVLAAVIGVVNACVWGAWAAYVWPPTVSDFSFDGDVAYDWDTQRLGWKFLPIVLPVLGVLLAWLPTVSHRTTKHVSVLRKSFGTRSNSSEQRLSISMAAAAFRAADASTPGTSAAPSRESSFASAGSGADGLPHIREASQTVPACMDPASTALADESALAVEVGIPGDEAASDHLVLHLTEITLDSQEAHAGSN